MKLKLHYGRCCNTCKWCRFEITRDDDKPYKVCAVTGLDRTVKIDDLLTKCKQYERKR
jgi:hypothetical protein